jgi:low temperature requirement protein LtrA
MIAASRGEWIIRTGHFAERHGLIIIIALGEVIVALGLPVVSSLEGGDGIPGQTVIALVASGALAGLLWWSYFDRPGPALELRGEEVTGGMARGRYVRDVYTWAHAPFVIGVILAAAALEEIALHPSDPVAENFRLMLFAGLALTAVSVGIAIWRAFRVVPPERSVAVVVLGLLILLAGSWNGVVLLVAIDVVILGTLIVENRRIEN